MSAGYASGSPEYRDGNLGAVRFGGQGEVPLNEEVK
jgi:hypothetical protein